MTNGAGKLRSETLYLESSNSMRVAFDLGGSIRAHGLLIVDGHAYAYRAFHAIRGMRSPTGEPTNAIFGFIKMLAKLRSNLAPSHLLVVWDGGLNSNRLAALPEYKAQRPPMPAELAVQIDKLVAYLGAAGVASYCREGVEADDYIASVAKRAEQAGFNVIIASSDKDFMQLVTPESKSESATSRLATGNSERGTRNSGSGTGRICLFNPHDKTETVWTAEQVLAKTGVHPMQIVDWLALIGDNVDNIPGVPGVGPKTAAELLEQFGSVAELYTHLEAVKSDRLRAALQASAEVVKRNLDLIRLPDDLATELELEDLAERAADDEALCEMFRSWGFRSMLAEIEQAQSRQAILL